MPTYSPFLRFSDKISFSMKIPFTAQRLKAWPSFSLNNPLFSLQSLHEPFPLSSALSPLSKNPFSAPHKMITCINTSTSRSNRENHPPQFSHHPNRPGTGTAGIGTKFATFFSPISSNQVPHIPFCPNGKKTIHTQTAIEGLNGQNQTKDGVWLTMRAEAHTDVYREPILSKYYQNVILSHQSLESALSNHLAVRLSNSSLPCGTLNDLFQGVLSGDPDIMNCVREDLRAVKDRDPACKSYAHCFLNYKGFLAIQSHRIAHRLWSKGRQALALIIQNRVSEVFAVDVHPGARIGFGILLDHATGVVVGETAVIGNNVSILHNVTLGGTGKMSGDRHPKIGDGVLIGAGTCILGNIKIGEGVKIGAGSVVLKDVPPRTTVVGNPARLVGGKENPVKLDDIPSLTMDHTSHINEWSDYVI